MPSQAAPDVAPFPHLNALDRLFLDRAYELAERGIGETSPNPPVGAVIVRGENVLGEGYHHRAGEPHAEVNALRAAGQDARDATLYVSLEPCAHTGRTPPCAQALVDSGIARVVIGAMDPNPRTGGRGAAALREAGIAVDVADDARAAAIVEPFARAIRGARPFVSLKMAASLDGYAVSEPGTQQWLTGEDAREYVRELRIAHDAVIAGAGTVRIDDPQLTVRPAHARALPYVRIVACESDAVPVTSRIFAPVEGYARSIVLAPAGARSKFSEMERVAEVLYIGDVSAVRLDLSAAFAALRERDITSLLCEGGPTMAAHLLSAGLVDRLHWIVAPLLLGAPQAVRVCGPAALPAGRRIVFDRVRSLGRDALISGRVEGDV